VHDEAVELGDATGLAGSHARYRTPELRFGAAARGKTRCKAPFAAADGRPQGDLRVEFCYIYLCGLPAGAPLQQRR